MSTPRPDEGRRAPSPVKVFAILLSVVAVGAGAILLTRDEGVGPTAATRPAGSPSATDLSLTDAEAIAVFEDLNGLRQRALERRDKKLVDAAFTRQSPAARRLKQSIQTLRRNGAYAEEQREVLRIAVISSDAEEIRLRETILLDVIFTNASGKDITRGGGLEKQKIQWTLRRHGERWLIHDGSIVSSRALDDK